MPTNTSTTLISLCANSRVRGERRWCNKQHLHCDSALTGVAVVLFVALQLEVFVPHTQLLTAGDPHTQTLQHQQTLRRHTMDQPCEERVIVLTSAMKRTLIELTYR